MKTEQIEMIMAGIKGLVDASSIRYHKDVSQKNFKRDIKDRVSHFIPINDTELSRLVVKYALAQFNFERALKKLQEELYKNTASFGDMLLLWIKTIK